MLNINVSDPKAFESAIKSVYKFADNSPHNSLPTCQVMVQSAENGLILTATDLTTAVEFAVNSSEVIESGEFCIPAKHLLKLGELSKDQSGISLEQTESGLNLTLSDAPTFGATFEVSETDEFPMLPEVEAKAHWIELSTSHIAIIKALTKYAATDNHRVGYDAIQFAMQDDRLFAFATDGRMLGSAELGRTSELPNFAIPVEAIKKALQVTRTPDLKNSDWRITLPTDDREVMNIQIQETAVKFRSEYTIDWMDWLLNVRTHHSEDNNTITFDPKALCDGLKKVSKLFINDKKFTNVLIIEGNANGRITMTSEVKKSNFGTPTGQQAIDMQAEYVHKFSDAEAVCRYGSEFRIQVDAKKFQAMVKDLAVSKPKYIQVQSASDVPSVDDDSVRTMILVKGLAVCGTELPLGFITMPATL